MAAEHKDREELILYMLKTLQLENRIAHKQLGRALGRQNGRIRKLENWRNRLLGVSAGASACVAFAASWLFKWLTGRGA